MGKRRKKFERKKMKKKEKRMLLMTKKISKIKKMKTKGIIYFKNNDRQMGDFQNGKPVGKHAKLHFNGEITSKIYN